CARIHSTHKCAGKPAAATPQDLTAIATADLHDPVHVVVGCGIEHIDPRLKLDSGIRQPGLEPTCTKLPDDIVADRRPASIGGTRIVLARARAPALIGESRCNDAGVP